MAVRGLAITDPAGSSLNNTFERALVSMHKMPRIWLEYLVGPSSSKFSISASQTQEIFLPIHVHGSRALLVPSSWPLTNALACKDNADLAASSTDLRRCQFVPLTLWQCFLRAGVCCGAGVVDANEEDL